MNDYTLVTIIIIILLSSCIMPTLSDRFENLDKQADSRIERLKDLGRMQR